jgi:hypothetical protein
MIVGDDNMPEPGDLDDEWEWQPDPRFDCACACIRCGPADKHDCGMPACVPGGFIPRSR